MFFYFDFGSDAPDKKSFVWSGRWDSNPRPQPWQGCALPLSYARVPLDGLILLTALWRKRVFSGKSLFFTLCRHVVVGLASKGVQNNLVAKLGKRHRFLYRVALEQRDVMDYIIGQNPPQPQATPGAPVSGAMIVDADQRSFMPEVLDASRQMPVLVDFWAPGAALANSSHPSWNGPLPLLVGGSSWSRSMSRPMRLLQLSSVRLAFRSSPFLWLLPSIKARSWTSCRAPNRKAKYVASSSRS